MHDRQLQTPPFRDVPQLWLGNIPESFLRTIAKGHPMTDALLFERHWRKDYSAEERTLPSLMRLAITSSAMDFGTASYCLKIIENVPRPCVTVRMAFE